MTIDWTIWLGFCALIVLLLAVDLMIFNRGGGAVSVRSALLWSLGWTVVGLLFAVFLWLWQGGDVAEQYVAGFVIEKSLSIDNIFVFALILTYFAVPRIYRNVVLFWGVVVAIVLRALFIVAGTALLGAVHWVIYLFGALLLYTGFKMARERTTEIHPEQNPALRLFRRFVATTPEYQSERIVVRRAGKIMATPLAPVLLLIATTDLVFAIDSIPAVFAVTTDTFLVFSSNAFAILGMRALYFLLADLMGRFIYLQVGLGAVLGFAGLKMLLADVYHIPVWLALAVIMVILTVATSASLLRSRSGHQTDLPRPVHKAG
jgi:tellurite resistance protein TerC